MCARNSDGLYAFKVFHFEKIEPSANSEIPRLEDAPEIVADSSNLYCLGGSDLRANPVSKFSRFNFASKRWTLLRNDQNLIVRHNNFVLHGNILVIYGKTSRCRDVLENKLHVCNISDGNSIFLAVQTTGKDPPVSFEHFVFFHDDYLYTIGSKNDMDVYRMDIKTKTWEEVYVFNGHDDSAFWERGGHEVVVDDKFFYVLGGAEDGEFFCNLQEIPCFSIEKRKWFMLQSIGDRRRGYPEPRAFHIAAQIIVDGVPQVFVRGGGNDNGSFNDLWKLNLKTYQWTFIEICHCSPESVDNEKAVSPEGRLYLAGEDRAHGETGYELYSVWLCIPKLSEMCWDAVLFYFPNINRSSVDDLISIGIPRKFLERLDNIS